MEDIAKLLGDHRVDLERWFDAEMSRWKIVKGEQLGLCDDLAKTVLGQVGQTIGSNVSGSPVTPRAPVPCQSTITLNVRESVAHMTLRESAAHMTRPLTPTPSPTPWKLDDMDGSIHLPGTVPEHGPSKSTDSQKFLMVPSEASAVAPSSKMQPKAFGKQGTASSIHSPIPLLYGSARRKSSNTKHPKSRSFFRQMTADMSLATRGTSPVPAVQIQCSWEVLRSCINSPLFRAVCGGVILINAVFLGIACDNMAESAMLGRADVDMVFEKIEIGFCAFFLAELMIRFLAEGWAFFKSKSDGWWNIFDTVLVGLSLIDVALTLLQAGKAMNFTFARVMRLFRFVRILRIVRVMRFFYSFRLMIYSVVYSILCLLWVFGMLFFIMYFFALFFLHGVSEHFRTYYEDNDGAICETSLCLELQSLCGDVVNMVLSLFMSICGGVDWRDLWVILRDVSWVYGWAFIFYIFFMVFGVLNVVVATFVEQSSLISQRDRELVTQNELEKNRQYYNNIRGFFEEADLDGSGTLSSQEFEDYLGDENVQAYFQSFELDVTQARTLFRLLDLDESDDVDIDEFVEGCMRMRGQARSIDVHMLLYENEKMICRTVEFMQYVEESLQQALSGQQQQETEGSFYSRTASKLVALG